MSSILSRSALAALLLAALLLAGCGGGGGNGNNTVGGGSTGTGTGAGTTTGTGSGTGTGTGGQTGDAAVVGKVVDVSGNGVVGASVAVDSGGVVTTSLSQGGYRLDGLGGSTVHLLTAIIRLNSVNYTGSTQVLAEPGQVISNANILLSRQDRQATVQGTVTDTTGRPLAGVRVFLAVPNGASATATGNYSSLLAFTDSNGNYSIGNVPTDLPGGQVVVTASTEGAQNATGTLHGLQAGGGYRQDFQLSPSSQQAVVTPKIVAVVAFTQPSAAPSANLRRPHALAPGLAGVYETLRRRLVPAYARMANGHAATRTRRRAHLTGGFGDYAIEADVALDTTVAQPASLFSYLVYRSTGTNPPTQSTTNYDILQDPLASYYTDLDPSYVPNEQYNFALSALNTDRQESGLSSPYGVVPLGPLALSVTGQTTTTGTTTTTTGVVTLNWGPVAGATKYYVFVYSQFPSLGVAPDVSYPLAGGTPLPTGTGTYTVGFLPAGTYYAVVVGAADQTEASAVTITNAATTFSQITPFTVP